MEYSNEHLNELQLCIKRDFELNQDSIIYSSEFSDIRKNLITIVHYLINKDFNRLLSIFYRIDLSEKEVSKILTNAPPDDIPSLLADLIIEREMKKVETRLKYKNNID